MEKHVLPHKGELLLLRVDPNLEIHKQPQKFLFSLKKGRKTSTCIYIPLSVI